MVLDGDISMWWCLGAAWRCNPAEAIGLWSVVCFYVTMFIVTVMHSISQHSTGTATRNEEATRRHVNAATDANDEWITLFSFLFWFFSFAMGMLLWALGGLRFVHPTQSLPMIQLFGAAILWACAAAFVAAHVNMGENWSPEPEQKARHQLVTHGVFRWARHPMYAVFLWAAIGTLLATLNWLIAWVVFGVVLITFRRIETEERILISLFGSQYLDYRRRVSALGPPWSCLGFDREIAPGNGGQREYRVLGEVEAMYALARGRSQ